MTAAPTVRLRPRQRETLLLLAAGLSNGQIAARVGLTEAAVKSRVAVLMKALEATSRVDVAVTGLRLGLITHDEITAARKPPRRPRKPRTPQPAARRTATRTETR